MAQFDSARYKIGKYLSGLRASIPDFQRGYSWEQDQISDFMNDLIDETQRDENSEYFFGPIVVVKPDHADGRKQIIDGQQRLTTVTIFLSVCRDLLSAMSDGPADPDMVRAIQILVKYIGEEDSLRLLQRGQGADYFKQEIQSPKNYDSVSMITKKPDTRKLGPKPAQNIIAHAYNQILDRIEGLATDEQGVRDNRVLSKKVNLLLKTLLTHFVVVEISTETTVNAFQIFQTLNARGKDLTPADLVKSYFFGKPKSQEQNKAMQKSWQNAQTNLQTEDITDYLRYLWNSQHSFARKRNLYRKVIEHCSELEDAIEFTSDIDKYSHPFAQISEVSESDTELLKEMGSTSIDTIKELNTMNFHAYYPLVLAMLKRQVPVNDFAKVTDLIEQVLLRNKILNGGTNWLEKLMANEAVSVSASGTVDAVMDDLRDRTLNSSLNDQTVSSALLTYNFQADENLAKSLLRIIENHRYDGKERGGLISRSDVHLEHIMPRVPQERAQWGNFDDEDDFQSCLWNIGNLTLWYGSDNSSLKNLSFDDKKNGEPGRNNGYVNSTVSLTNELATTKEWNKGEIRKRAERLTHDFLHIAE